MSSRSRLGLRLLAPVAAMAAIFYFSSQPFDGPELAWWEVVLRKLGHVSGYFLLTSAWWWALVGVIRRPLLAAALISLAYAAGDEYHQTFVEGRTGTPVDVCIDATGIALAALLINRSIVKRRPQGSKTKQFKDAGQSPKRAY
ncbi:MAG: VanZ family protein [Actinomycetota bacterium]|nr:VanZ family protein [Actinomycetota bacterium]